jgi:hypothetical protein
MVDDDFVKELFTGLDLNKMKKRNQQITEHIRKLLINNPQQKYLFVVGAGYSSKFFLPKKKLISSFFF